MMLRVGLLLLVLEMAAASQAAAEDVTFHNSPGTVVVVSMFVGPMGTSPDHRGQANVHISRQQV
ncbi:hypothetical protein [Mesorhizobium sp. M0816]|uniref:hypothetical protein n=1 Tax=Mesorhizobium sp. M0816 TaxID=2957006 RepID=UPI00333949B3